MSKAICTTLGLLILAGVAMNAARAEEPAEASFGEALYFAYQGKWFEALVRLNSGIGESRGDNNSERDMLQYESAAENFSVGELELSYRMYRRASRMIETALLEASNEPLRNNAAYRLARLHFRRGQEHDALRALDRISGDVPGDIRDDVASLRANVYLALEWPDPAIPILEKLRKSKEYGAFAAYNLGIAYLQGDLQRAAYDQLDRAGSIKPKNAADAAIRDKANLVLGTLLHEQDQYSRAITYLSRVRLDGPFSNRALLSAGWASMSAGKPERAIVSWGTLAERDATDRATQEALLALPYAYGQLGYHDRAAAYYGSALDAYAVQIGKLNQSIRSIEDGRFLDALLRHEILEDENWVIRLRALPDTPETFYLIELLASNSFQTGLENYLDLADLKRRLSDWATSLSALDELVAVRDRHYSPLLPKIDQQSRTLNARLREGFQRYEELVAQRRSLLQSTVSQADREARLEKLDQNLQSLADALALAQQQYDRFAVARQAIAESYAGYDKPLGELSDATDNAIGIVGNLMERQGKLLEKLATDELAARQRRLEVYAGKARFGLADSMDRITRRPEQ